LSVVVAEISIEVVLLSLPLAFPVGKVYAERGRCRTF